jgi:hypothetical protein
VVFVHEEDENAHVMIDLSLKDEDKPIPPAIQTTLYFGKGIERDAKPGVYRLDTIKFETFGGESMDYRGEFEPPRFEVIPEREWEPIVKGISVLTKGQSRHWERRDRD